MSKDTPSFGLMYPFGVCLDPSHTVETATTGAGLDSKGSCCNNVLQLDLQQGVPGRHILTHHLIRPPVLFLPFIFTDIESFSYIFLSLQFPTPKEALFYSSPRRLGPTRPLRRPRRGTQSFTPCTPVPDVHS